MTDLALQSRRYGTAAVTTLGDGVVNIPFAMLSDITEQDGTALLQAASEPVPPRSSINAFLVQMPGHTVLIDTGAGTLMGSNGGRLRSLLAAAGVDPGAVGTVLLTHLHSDHIGGLVTDGAAAFPNAELVVHADEVAYFLDPAQEAAAPEGRRAGFARARAALAPYAGRVRTLTGGEALPGITAVPLPGHTPGHTGYRIGTGAEALLVWGDIVHVPVIQSARPEVCIGFDVDPVRAAETRRQIMAQAADENLAVAGMHMHLSGIAHVVRAGSGYRLIQENPPETA